MATVFRPPITIRITWPLSSPWLTDPGNQSSNCGILRGKDQIFGAAGQPPTYDYPNPRGKPFPTECLSFIKGTSPLLSQSTGSFKYSSPITVTSNSALLPSTQTNFPVLVSFTNNRLKTEANGGHVSNASGFDIRPFADSALTSALSFELESYNGSTGTVLMWVRIPSLSLGLTFYLAYGNAVLTTNGSTNATWDSHFKAVYHFGDGSSVNGNDSTGNAQNLSTSGSGITAASGQLGGGAVFSGAGSLTNTGGGLSVPTGTAARTLSVWFKQSDLTNRQGIFGWGDFGGSAGAAFQLEYISPFLILNINSGGPGFNFTTDNTTWHLAHAVTTGGTTDADIKVYIDGVDVTGNPSGTTLATTSTAIAAGQWTNASVGFEFFYTGSLDESRISDVARSADWIKTEYNSQSAPTTFLSLGTEQKLPASIPIDFPNPLQSPRRGIDLYGYIQPSNRNLHNVVVIQNPFNLDDWPNPVLSKYVSDVRLFALRTNPALYQSGKPFNQQDWPNPIPPRWAIDVRTIALSTNPNIYQSGKPFKQDDWQNPWKAKANQDWLQSTNLNLPVPFAQRDWPNPLGSRRNPDFALSTNPTIYPSGKPFKQGDYPNPIWPRQPAESRSFTFATNPTLYPTGAAPTPFHQTEWPNPRATTQAIDNRIWIESLNPLQLGKDQFFTGPGRGPVYDYPNPKGKPFTDGFTQSVNIGLTTKPFLQTDWPNPTLATVRRADWILSTAPTQYQSGKPLKYDDWENPLGPRRKPDLTNFLLPRNFEFYPPFVEQFIVQDTPTVANVIGVSNSAFLLLAAQSTSSTSSGLQTDASILTARSTRDSVTNVRTKLIIFTANDKQVGD